MSELLTRKPAPQLLVVDEDPRLCTSLHDTLATNGYRIQGVATGEEALKGLRQTFPDLLVVGDPAGELDPWSICRELRNRDRERGRYTPLLMILDPHDSDATRRAFRSGATDILFWPLDSELLHTRLDHLLELGASLRPLTEIEARLAHAQRIARLGDWQWEPETGRFRGSQEFLRLVSAQSPEPIESLEGFLETVHPQHRPLVAAAFRESGRNGTPLAFEFQVLGEEGGPRTVLCRGELEDGRSRFIGTLQDVTAHRETENQLQLLKEAVECLPVGLTVSDAEGNILYANPAEARMHGTSVDELVSRKAWSLAPAHLRREVPKERLSEFRVWKRKSINLRRNGEQFPVQLSSITVRNPGGDHLGIVTVCEDITEREAADRRIRQLAYYDSLTELPNRWMFRERLGKVLALADRDNHRFGLLFIDLDHFKDVNDCHGHAFGDRLLRMVAQRLCRCTRNADTLARLGGDEFVVILDRLSGNEAAAQAAWRIIEVFSAPFHIDGHTIYLGASLGIALYPEDGREEETLLKNADLAMYDAKSQGRNRCRFFTEEMNRQVVQKVALEGELRRTLEQEALELNYQPQWDLATGTLVGVEALLRWTSSAFGAVGPDRVIPLAESNGLICRLSEWILRTACTQGLKWLEGGAPGWRLGVNMSGHDFRRRDFLDMIDAVLAETGFPPQRLELEFTESVLLDREEVVLENLQALKKRGIGLSVDDFGTGFSALNYLKRLPVDRIKIDRSFIGELGSDSTDRAVIEAIALLGRRLRLKVLAEGVETRDQLDRLRELGCDQGQGFYLGPPVAAAELPRFFGPAAETAGGREHAGCGPLPKA